MECLSDSYYSLFSFKAVQGPYNGVPLVWQKTLDYGLTTQIVWNDTYQAYSSFSSIQNTQTININNSYAIATGDRFTITSTKGTGSVTSDGSSPDGIDIYNKTTTQFTCGISQTQSSVACPTCAFTLYGQMQDTITPLEKVMLMFSIAPVNAGDVMEISDSQCILIDLSADSTREVTYQINFGWDTGSQTGMTIYPPNTALAPLLIQSQTTLNTSDFSVLNGFLSGN